MRKHRIARGARPAMLAAISILLLVSTQSRPLAWSSNWTTGGPDGASVFALVIDPTNADVLYAGLERGGVWKSVDAGQTWSQSGTTDQLVSVSELAVVPGSPQTLFAATFSQLFKTTNGGLTWTVVNMGASNAIRDLDIDPLSPNAIYVVLQNTGVRRSMDGGVTWDWLPGPSGLAFIGMFAVDPTNSNTLYAAHNSTLFKSVDRGVTWTETNLNSAPSQTLAVDPLNPSTLYGSDVNGILRKSVNGGTTWQAVLPQTADIRCVLVDADNPGVVYAAGRGVFKSIDAGANWTTSDGLPGSVALACLLSSSSSQTLYTGWSGAGVYKTNDGAATWAPARTGLRHTNITAVVAHPEQAGIAYSAVQGGGVFKTVNSGGTWTPVNGGLTNWIVFGLGMDPQSPDTLYAATTTGIFKTIDGGTAWMASNAGLANTDVRYVAVDPVNTQNVYVSGFAGVSKSTDGGATWGAINNGLTQGGNLLPIHVDPTNSEVVYTARFPNFYRSDDGGANWLAVASGIGSFRDFAIDPLTPTTIYALSTACCGSGNKVLKSVDGGATWFASDAGIPSDGGGTGSIAIDPVTPNLIYVGMQSGRNVFVSADGGATWTQLPTFAASNVLALTVQRADGSNVVYAGTDGGGVFTRADADVTPPQVLCAAADVAWHNSDVTISCTAGDEESGLENAADASFNLTTNVPAGTETASAATNSRQVCDVAGNCITAGPVAGNMVDKKAPTIACGTVDGVWHSADVSVPCTASDAGSGLANPADASFNLTTSVAAGTETTNAATNSRQVCDALGACTTAGPIASNKVDKKAPTIACGTVDGVWHSADVSVPCTASDAGSGLANPADASFNLTTSVAAGTETTNAATNSRQVCDALAACTTAGPIASNKVDKKGPTITVTSPAANATYQLNGAIAASYACTDGGSGLASCAGPVSNGSSIDTSSTGGKTFTVVASDNVGNSLSSSVTYSVASGGGGGSTSADVGITLAGPGRVSPGETLTYVISVSTAGRATATDVTVSDALPVGTVFNSASTSQGTIAAPPVGSNGTVRVSIGTLANGATATINIVVGVTASRGTTLTNTATVSATTQDLNSRNNSATQRTTVR